MGNEFEFLVVIHKIGGYGRECEIRDFGDKKEKYYGVKKTMGQTVCARKRVFRGRVPRVPEPN